MEPTAFVDFAKGLLQEAQATGDEPKLRTVVNRAYLGALLESARNLEPLRVESYPPTGRFYGLVERDLGSEVGPGAGSKLATLRDYRKDADYDITNALPSWMPGRAVGVAEEILRVLREKFRS